MLKRLVAMTLASQIVPDGPVETMEFERLKASDKSSTVELIVREFGVAYVTSITRDGCSGCAEQKPFFRELAGKLTERHQGLVRFTNVHIRYLPEDQKVSWDAKRVFGHAAYPTYMVHVKSHLGPLEVYRAVYPTMEELEKQTTEGLELAEYYKTEDGKL